LKHNRQGRRLVLFLSLGVLILLAGCTGGVPASSWFGISASGTTVFLAANSQVIALNLENGSQLWSFPVEAQKDVGPFYAKPLSLNNTLVVGSYASAGTLYGLSPSGGAQSWSVALEAPIVAGATPVSGGFVVADDAGAVFFVDSETQAKRPLVTTRAAVWDAPLVDEAQGRVYVASLDHSVYAVDFASGDVIWTFEAGGALIGTPTLGSGVLYFGSLDDTFYAVDASTGQELWQFSTDGWVLGSPVVDSGTVYFGSMAGTVYALSATDGSQSWTFEADGGVRAGIVLEKGTGAGDLLYVGTRPGTVYALRTGDGTQVWSLPLNGPIYSKPVLHNGLLLVSPFNAKVQLAALDPESGAQRWSYPSQ
jgi:glucose dehydrogenase